VLRQVRGAQFGADRRLDETLGRAWSRERWIDFSGRVRHQLKQSDGADRRSCSWIEVRFLPGEAEHQQRIYIVLGCRRRHVGPERARIREGPEIVRKSGRRVLKELAKVGRHQVRCRRIVIRGFRGPSREQRDGIVSPERRLQTPGEDRGILEEAGSREQAGGFEIGMRCDGVTQRQFGKGE
jgi:hypothetical protein